MLLCAQAIAPQTGQNLGCNYFALFARFLPFCKNLLCPAAAPSTIVLPVSPEAGLPTGKSKGQTPGINVFPTMFLRHKAVYTLAINV